MAKIRKIDMMTGCEVYPEGQVPALAPTERHRFYAVGVLSGVLVLTALGGALPAPRGESVVQEFAIDGRGDPRIPQPRKPQSNNNFSGTYR